MNLPETYPLTIYKAQLIVEMYMELIAFGPDKILKDKVDLIGDIDYWRKCKLVIEDKIK